MKKCIAFALALGALSLSPLFADNDKVVTLRELPKSAQTFVQKFFSNQTPSLVTLDNDLVSKTYEVIYAGGTRLEFDSKGNWQEVEIRQGAIPAGIVPQSIEADVAKRFPGQTIQHIERKRRGFEVELTNGIELEYNRQGKLLRTDN